MCRMMESSEGCHELCGRVVDPCCAVMLGVKRRWQRGGGRKVALVSVRCALGVLNAVVHRVVDDSWTA